MIPGSLTGVLRDLAARPGGLGRDLSFASGTAAAAAKSFEVPDDAPLERRDSQQSRAVGGPSTRPGAAGAAAAASERRMMAARQELGRSSDSEDPAHFRRRSEPMPGTYDSTGKFARVAEPDEPVLSRGKPGGQLLAADRGGRGVAATAAADVAIAAARAAVRATEGAAVASPSEPASDPPSLSRAAPLSGEVRELTPQDEAVIRALKRIERELMTREMEQSQAGGGVSGNARHLVETGPDGERYVTDGETSPSLVHGGTPEQQLVRARAVRRAALAPSTPSTRDLAVASEARRLERRAEAKVDQATAEVSQARDMPEIDGLSELQALLTREELASARRGELREEDARQATVRQAARGKLSVAAVDDPTIPNPEVVTLKGQVAVDAYLEQL